MRQLDPQVASERKQKVLQWVVHYHIKTSKPIVSSVIAEEAGLDLSSATLRSILKELEDLGYLHQPHTSAGRVPTDRGYRFFIDHLMQSHALSAREREAIDDQVAQASEIDQVLQLTSRLLSKLSDQVGVVFMPTLLQLAIRSMDFVLVAET